MEKKITKIRISRKGLKNGMKNGMKKNINCPIGKIILDKKEEVKVEEVKVEEVKVEVEVEEEVKVNGKKEVKVKGKKERKVKGKKVGGEGEEWKVGGEGEEGEEGGEGGEGGEWMVHRIHNKRLEVDRFIQQFLPFIPTHYHSLLFIPDSLLFHSQYIHFHIFAIWFFSLSKLSFHQFDLFSIFSSFHHIPFYSFLTHILH